MRVGKKGSRLLRFARGMFEGMHAFDAAQIADLETMLGCAIPAPYQALLQQFSPPLSSKRYGGSHRLCDHELFDDPARVVTENQSVRTHPTWGPSCESAWPSTHLVIGMDMSGDAIFIDAASGAASVYRYFVETGETIEVAPDVATYASMLLTGDPSLRRS